MLLHAASLLQSSAVRLGCTSLLTAVHHGSPSPQALKSAAADMEREFEEIKRQLEEDADREIEDMKEKYEQRLQVNTGGGVAQCCCQRSSWFAFVDPSDRA